MRFELIQTHRLILRKLTPVVYQEIFQYRNEQEIKLLLGLKDDEALKSERDKMARGISTWNRSFLVFQLLDRQTATLVGWCGYHTWYTEHNRAEIGYAITNEAFKNRGLMKEAMEVVILYGFEKMKLQRIEAFVGPSNMPSLRLMEHFGFTKEGHLRKHYCKNGQLEDSMVFSLLADEYEPAG